MGGSSFLLVLLVIALLVLMLVVLVQIGTLSSEMREVKGLLKRSLDRTEAPAQAAVPSEPVVLQVKVSTPAAPPPFVPPPRVVIAEQPAPRPLLTEPVLGEHASQPPPKVERTPVVEAPPSFSPPPPPRSTFSSRNPDLEKFIGENLINKIGIGVLVLGIGFLLRYASNKGYIGESGRALIGLLVGGILVFLAHRLHKKFRAFSSVLVAGGIAVFYFTIGFAFHQYHLIGQTAAFISMVGITGLAVALTLAYDRKELAVIALLGGFVTPLIASTGQGNYRALFTYLLILDVGMLVLANYKKWSVINVIAFALSWLFFGLWSVIDYSDLEPPPIWGALGFATGFYAVFATMVLWYDLRHRSPFGALDYSLFLANTALYFGLGLFFLDDASMRLSGLFTAALGAVNLVLALRFFRDQTVPRNLVYLLIGLVLTFLSLAAPVQLEGNHITMFWAAECVLLLWFSQRSGLKLVEVASILVLVIMLISLFQDLVIIQLGDTSLLRPLLNKAWVTGMAASVALFLYARLARGPVHGVLLPAAALRTTTEVALAIVLYTVNFLELQAQCAKHLTPSCIEMALAAYTLAFALVLDLMLRKRARTARAVVATLFALLLLSQATAYYASSRSALFEQLQLGMANRFSALHLINLALTVLVVVRFAFIARALVARDSATWRIYLWGMCALLVVLASQELDHALISANFEEPLPIPYVLDRARKWGYPILWGAGSFVMMLYGMRTRQRPVRIFALLLFGITLAKLFLFDIRGVSEGGKVAAFISLGVLLLVVSFLYQRLKGLLIDGPESAKTEGDAQV